MTPKQALLLADRLYWERDGENSIPVLKLLEGDDNSLDEDNLFESCQPTCGSERALIARAKLAMFLERWVEAIRVSISKSQDNLWAGKGECKRHAT